MEKIGDKTFDHETASPEPIHPESSTIVFEDYLHHAAIQRRAEDGHVLSTDEDNKENWFYRLSTHKGPNVNVDVRHAHNGQSNESVNPTDEERVNALRALRTASWASVFYLITTDILGPFNAPFAISQVGWVPGTYSIDML